MANADLPPNVLIVLLDDVGVDKVSPYHYPEAPPTPVIDGLADQGVRFDQAWATPVCSPTRAALMTGRFAYRNEVGAVIMTKSDKELPLGETTIPEMLDKSDWDWSTAAVGKWHLATEASHSGTRHPLEQGFDRFSGSLNNIAGSHTYTDWERVNFQGRTVEEHEFSTSRIVDDAIEALGELKPPFFLYVALHAAHRPLMVPPESLLGGFQVNPGDENSLYDANMIAADAEIGRLLRALGDRRDRTLIFVLGDNGTPGHAKDADGMEGGKGSLTEGGLRVPLIVAGPGVQHGVSDALVSVVDVFPTLMDVAGVKNSPPLDGVSMMRALHDPGDAKVHDIVYSETRHPADGPPWRSVMKAARDQTLKVVDEDGDRSVWRIQGFQESPVSRSDLDPAEKKRVKALEDAIDRTD